MDSAKEIEKEEGVAVDSAMWRSCENKGSRIAFMAPESGERERACNFSIPIARLPGNGHTCQWPTMDANEVSLCNSI